MKNRLCVLGGLLFLATQVHAASMRFAETTDQLWTNVANWDKDYLPGATATDRAIVAAGDNCIISNMVQGAGAIDFDFQSTSTCKIYDDVLNVRKLWVRGGTITQYAGDIIASDTDDVYIGGTADGIWTIYGGTLSSTVNMKISGIGTLCVSAPESVGSVVEVTDELTIETGGVLRFILDADGVAHVNLGALILNAGALLEIDGAAYGGEVKEITLLTAGTMAAGFPEGSYTVDGLGDEGGTWELVQDLAAGTIKLKIKTDRVLSLISIKK